MATARGLKELPIEAFPVVGDQRRISCPGRKLAQHILRSRGTSHVTISNTGIALDERRNRTPGLGKTEKFITGAQATSMETDGRALDKLIAFGMQAGGLQIVDHKTLSAIETFSPDKTVSARRAISGLPKHGFGTRNSLVARWIWTLDFHLSPPIL
jgi:hypothetical protein